MFGIVCTRFNYVQHGVYTFVLRSALGVHVFTTLDIGLVRFYYVRHWMYTFLLRSAWVYTFLLRSAWGAHVFIKLGMG